MSNQGSITSVLHCPNNDCRKPIMSQAAIAEGTNFVIRCPSCHSYVRIMASFNYIHKKVISQLHERTIVCFTAD